MERYFFFFFFWPCVDLIYFLWNGISDIPALLVGSKYSFPRVVLTLVRVLADEWGRGDTLHPKLYTSPHAQEIPATSSKRNGEAGASLGS